MASVWQFASTRGLIFLADAQSVDPEELQVLDIFLVSQLVVKPSVFNAPGHTEDSLQMTPSPYLGHTQQSSTSSRIPVIASQLKPRRITVVWPELGAGLSWEIVLGFVDADGVYDDMSNLVNLN